MTELQAEITTGTPATLTTLLKASTPTRGSACESSTAACTLMPPYFLERLMSSTLIRAAFTWSNPKAALLPVMGRTRPNLYVADFSAPDAQAGELSEDRPAPAPSKALPPSFRASRRLTCFLNRSSLLSVRLIAISFFFANRFPTAVDFPSILLRPSPAERAGRRLRSSHPPPATAAAQLAPGAPPMARSRA